MIKIQDDAIRERYLNLSLAGGNPDLAYIYCNKYTVREYEDAAEQENYKQFADNLEKNFFSKIDAILIGNLYRAQETLNTIGPEDKGYAAIMKNYIDLLKITQPIVERLNKQKLEVNRFEGMELIIQNKNGETVN
jgi:hypothetical protein